MAVVGIEWVVCVRVALDTEKWFVGIDFPIVNNLLVPLLWPVSSFLVLMASRRYRHPRGDLRARHHLQAQSGVPRSSLWPFPPSTHTRLTLVCIRPSTGADTVGPGLVAGPKP